ncbi:MAG: Hsp20/alpha crystallin family protein [Pirellulales bacterium]
MRDSSSRRTPGWFLPAAESFHQAGFSPPVDIYRDARGWLLKFDLAGVRPQDVEVTIRGCRVTLRGVRRDWLIEEEVASYSMEIAYSSFARTIELPCEVDVAEVQTEFRDGMLLVRLVMERTEA